MTTLFYILDPQALTMCVFYARHADRNIQEIISFLFQRLFPSHRSLHSGSLLFDSA